MEQEKSLIVICYFIGWSLGCSLAGDWGDKLGRVAGFWRLLYISMLGGAATFLVPEYYSYLFARALTGCGVGGLGIVTWVLSSEFWGGGYRNALACLGHIPYCIGLALYPAIVWPLDGADWRILSFIAAIPTFAYFFYARMDGRNIYELSLHPSLCRNSHV